MKYQLQGSTSRNMVEWRAEIKRLWTEKMDNSELLKKLVESMPRRLQEVIDREGNATKY
jgi:23S rRNA A2030 N6-methylase RlmJ